MKKHIVVIYLVFFGLMACSDQVAPKVIDFMEAYYVQANQQESLKLVTGPALEKIQKEMSLLTDVSPENRSAAQSKRSITYKLLETKKGEGQVSYLFEIDVNVQDLESFKKSVSVIFDTKAQKVLLFKEL